MPARHRKGKFIEGEIFGSGELRRKMKSQEKREDEQGLTAFIGMLKPKLV